MALAALTPRDADIVAWADAFADDVATWLSPGVSSLGSLVGLAGAMIVFVWAVADFAFGSAGRGTLKIIGLLLFIAVSRGLDEIFDAADAVADLPVAATVYGAQQAGEMFTTPGVAFPLRVRYPADFEARLTTGAHREDVETASVRCLTPGVMKALREGTSTAPELQKAYVNTQAGPVSCESFISTLDGNLPTCDQQKASCFSNRRAIARIAWDVKHPGVPLPDPGSAYGLLPRVRELALIFDPLETFGGIYGGFSVVLLGTNRLLMIFLLLPELWKLLAGYLLGMVWVRSWAMALYAGHLVSKSLAADLAAKDTDTAVDFLHSVSVYFYPSATSSEAAIASFYTYGFWVELAVMPTVCSALPLLMGLIMMARRIGRRGG